MSVQRWAEGFRGGGGVWAVDGEWVTYADHVAALAERDRLFAETLEAIQRLHDDTMQTTVADVAVYGQEKRAEALRQAREVVAGLPWKVAVSFGPIDCDESCEHGPCTCSGVMRPEAWMTGPADALAAIDALAAGQAPAAPLPPFPIGAKVRGKGCSTCRILTVTGWDFYPAWGKWFLRVESGDVSDEGEIEYALMNEWELELVPAAPGEVT